MRADGINLSIKEVETLRHITTHPSLRQSTHNLKQFEEDQSPKYSSYKPLGSFGYRWLRTSVRIIRNWKTAEEG